MKLFSIHLVGKKNEEVGLLCTTNCNGAVVVTGGGGGWVGGGGLGGGGGGGGRLGRFLGEDEKMPLRK